jgi:hypothetical protein
MAGLTMDFIAEELCESSSNTSRAISVFVSWAEVECASSFIVDSPSLTHGDPLRAMLAMSLCTSSMFSSIKPHVAEPNVSKKNVHQGDVNMDERKSGSEEVEDVSVPSSKPGMRFSTATHVDEPVLLDGNTKPGSSSDYMFVIWKLQSELRSMNISTIGTQKTLASRLQQAKPNCLLQILMKRNCMSRSAECEQEEFLSRRCEHGRTDTWVRTSRRRKMINRILVVPLCASQLQQAKSVADPHEEELHIKISQM